MRRLRLSHGITTGLLAASATTGALVGFGFRFGTPARPFNTLAALILGPRVQGIAQFAALPTLLGLVLHVLSVTIWGVIYVTLVERTGGHTLAWAVAIAVFSFLVSWVAALMFGVGLATLLPLGDRIALGVVLAGALVLGMRLALSHWRGDAVQFRDT